MKSLLGSPEGPGAKWRHRKGAKLSPFGLYMDLFMNRDDVVNRIRSILPFIEPNLMLN